MSGNPGASSHTQAKGTAPSGRRRQGVNRPADAPADRRKGAGRVPRLARSARRSRTGNPCASRMIPLESPVPEIGTPGSESGGRKRTHGSRPAARCESAGRTTDPYRLRASPRLERGLAGRGRQVQQAHARRFPSFRRGGRCLQCSRQRSHRPAPRRPDDAGPSSRANRRSGGLTGAGRLRSAWPMRRATTRRLT